MRGIKRKSNGEVHIMLMDQVYRLSAIAWRRYALARSQGKYPEPGGRGWTLVSDDLIRVTDMEDEDFKEFAK